MKSFGLSPTLVRSASAIAVAACMMVPSMAAAQDDPAAQGQDGAQNDDIVISGIRASLDRSIDIKRNSTGVVDAISAEDIGKFPDTNLAESLQRIPGVSINRVNGEGSEVTARGFGGGFNLVTLNGRQLPTANVVTVGGDQNTDFTRGTSRSFDFSNLASEGVSRMEVYKTGRAAIPTGGIGATINVVTRKPLDGGDSGIRGSIGAKGVYDTSGEDFKVTPEVSGLINWSDPNDTVGIGLFGSYQKRDSAAASATSNAWNIRRRDDFTNPGNGFVNGSTTITNLPSTNQLVSVPNDSRYHYSESERERINGQAVLQFRPFDGFEVTADALYVRNRTNEQRTDQTNWFNRPFRQVTFDGNPLVATTTYLQENISGVKDEGFEQQYRASKDQLTSFGLNATWDLTDSFKVTLDGHLSKSESRPDASNGTSSTLVSIGAPVIAGHSVDYSGPVPIQTITSFNDALRGNNNGSLDLGDVGTQVARTNTARQDQRIHEGRIDFDWDIGGGLTARAGGDYIDSRMISSQVSTQQTLGDWGITHPGDVAAFAPGLVETFCLRCQFTHFDVGGTGPELVAFRANAVDLYNALSPVYAADGDPTTAAIDPGHAVSITGNNYDVVREKTWAVYGQVNWDGMLGTMPATVVAGLRYEKTDVESHALQAIPTAILWVSDNDFTRVVSATPQPVDAAGSYDNFLPAIDISIEPVQDVKARFSYSKTLARADYGNLFASTNAGAPPRPTAIGGVASGSTGNPGLLPLVSDNFDVSLEWYFAPSSYVSGGFFYKNVKNFVGTGQTTQTLFGLRDPSSGAAGSRSGSARTALTGIGADISDVNLFTMTALIIQNGGNVAAATAQFNANYSGGALNQTFVDTVLAAVDVQADSNDPLFQFAVTSPINNRNAKIHGFELAGQYFLGNTGFGIAGSYTKVDGDVEIDVGGDPSIDQFALLGLSDSFNVTAIYEKYGFSARVAYNWRDKYLAQTNRGGNDRNPVFYAPFGTLDANISYDISDQIQVSIEGINLTGEPVRTYGRDETNLWFAQELHPIFLFGARFKF